MQHDIYALGVCLLEIGLWQSFVWYPDVDGDPGPDGVVVGEAAPQPGSGLQVRSALTDKVFERAHVGGRTAWVKEDLVSMARRLLPARMGEMYAGIVVACLACLDEGGVEFGGLGEDEAGDGIGVGVRFVEKILVRVGEIRV